MQYDSNIYDITFGKLFDYKALCDYLQNTDLLNNVSCFIDVPCGTGSLLNEIEKKINRLRVVGVDLSGEMLRKASEKLKNTTELYEADIFDFFKKFFFSFNTSIHVGYCFLNTLKEMDRIRLLQSITSQEQIRAVGFEIQSIYHQRTILPNKLYTHALDKNLFLTTKSFSKNEDSYKLETKFFNGKTVIYEKTHMLYLWDIKECEEVCKSYSWKVKVKDG